AWMRVRARMVVLESNIRTRVEMPRISRHICWPCPAASSTRDGPSNEHLGGEAWDGDNSHGLANRFTPIIGRWPSEGDLPSAWRAGSPPESVGRGKHHHRHRHRRNDLQVSAIDHGERLVARDGTVRLGAWRGSLPGWRVVLRGTGPSVPPLRWRLRLPFAGLRRLVRLSLWLGPTRGSSHRQHRLDGIRLWRLRGGAARSRWGRE